MGWLSLINGLLSLARSIVDWWRERDLINAGRKTEQAEQATTQIKRVEDAQAEELDEIARGIDPDGDGIPDDDGFRRND